MTDLPKYDLGDESRNARLEAFTACRDLTDLSREVGILREMLERAAQKDKQRLCVDIVGQLTKCSAAIQGAQLRAKELIQRDEVLRLCNRLVEIVHTEILLLNLPQDTRVELIERIVERIRNQAQEDALLLEVETQ